VDATCSACGSTLGREALWCNRCYAPTQTGGSHEPPTGPNGPVQITAEPLRAVHYSRWRGGTTTFGPVGRIVITLFVVGFAWLNYSMFHAIEGALAIADIAVYVLIGGWILKHVWKRGRVG
jgi:hypothetical protein